MTDFVRSAKKARSAGDYESAGDFLLLAGRTEDAVDAFMEGQHFRRAAEALESQGDNKRAAELFVRAGELKKAAEVYEELGELVQAGQLYASCDELMRGAQAYEKARRPTDAAELYQRIGDLARAGHMFLEANEPARAAEMFEELWLNRNRDDPRHMIKSILPEKKIAEGAAVSYLRSGDPGRAGLFFERAGLHERSAEAYAQGNDRERAARAYRRAGDLGRAAKILEEAESMTASEAELFGQLCREMGTPARAAAALEQAGNYREAAQAFESAGEKLRAAALFALVGDVRKAGRLFHDGGDLASAARAYEEAGMLESAATTYEEAGNLKRAADLARRMYRKLVSNPGPGGRPRVLAMGKRAADLALSVGDLERAADIFAEIGLAREAAGAYEQTGNLKRAAEERARLGEYAAARETFLKARLTVPPLVEAAYLESVGRFDESARVYERAGELEKAARLYQRSGAHGRAAHVLEQLQDFVRAAECYIAEGDSRRAAELFQKAGMLDRAADCLEEAGEFERAAYVHLLAERFLAAGRVFVKAKKLDDAVVLLQKLRPDNPEYLEGCLLLGDIFYQKQLYSLALDKYYKGLQDVPVSDTVLPSLYNLARTYEHLERFPEARECYEKILAIDYGYEDTRERREATFELEKQLRVERTPAPTPPPVVVRAEESGRFEVRGVLESDELGTFCRAWDRTHERPVMLRRFNAPEADPSKQERLLREAQRASGLHHGHILTIYDVGEESGVKFVSMEYVEGTTLRARLDAGERFDVYRAADVAAQVAMALDHAHSRELIHRSLRPETILVLSSGDVVKVRDFGFADRLTDTLRASGVKRYPLSYMAPEQILGRKIDTRSDIYSLGVVLYELIYGVPPFTGEDIIYQHVSRPVTFPSGGPIIPEHLKRTLARCLEKDPSRRFSSAREVADQLRRADVVPGTLIDGRYEVLEEIGSGGMGKVYRAADRELDETVALKILKAEYGESSDAMSRFLREIKLSRKIAHPNVVKVYDMGRFRGSRFISMEFIEGPPLDQWIRERKIVPLDEGVSIVKHLASALQAAHDLGIVHRDIKPQNVLLAGGKTPKIVDFGIARASNSEGVTLSGEVLGSPKYMCPENIEEGVLDRRADIYALGVLTYLMFTGKEPFTGDNPTAILLKHIHENAKRPTSLNPDIPDWLEALIMKSLAKDPDRRYQWAKELLEDIPE